MPYLLKTEPNKYSYDDLLRDGETTWDGIANPQALGYLRNMKKGEKLVIYHSNIGKEIVGVVEVVREAYPDPTAEKGDWSCVDMQAVGPMPKPVSLATIKDTPALADVALVRMSRLSVMPIAPEHWKLICKMGGWKK